MRMTLTLVSHYSSLHRMYTMFCKSSCIHQNILLDAKYFMIDRIKILWSGKSSLCPDWPERTWDGSRSWHASAASNCPGLTNPVWWRKVDTASISTSNYHKYCMVYWLETHSSFGFVYKVDLDIPGMLSLSGYYDSSPCRWRLQRGASACSAQLLLSAWEKKAMNGELGPELGAALCQT